LKGISCHFSSRNAESGGAKQSQISLKRLVSGPIFVTTLLLFQIILFTR